MAEFVQVMKDWRRMCSACQTEKDICGVCGCYPAGNYATCAMKSMDKEADLACDNLYFERLEKTIKVWAEEHPESVYPSWLEYLMNAFPDCGKAYMGGNDLLWKWMWETPIPADKAEKLGLKPK